MHPSETAFTEKPNKLERGHFSATYISLKILRPLGKKRKKIREGLRIAISEEHEE